MSIEKTILEGSIVDILKTVYDPEIPVDIYELGLIYGVEIDDDANVTVRMTLTSPHCPAAQSLPAEIQTKVSGVEGVASTTIDLVWDPPWCTDLMSDAAKLELGMF